MFRKGLGPVLSLDVQTVYAADEPRDSKVESNFH